MAFGYERIPELLPWSACENRDSDNDDVVYHNDSDDGMSTNEQDRVGGLRRCQQSQVLQ